MWKREWAAVMEGCQGMGVSRLAAPDELRLSSGGAGQSDVCLSVPLSKAGPGEYLLPLPQTPLWLPAWGYHWTFSVCLLARWHLGLKPWANDLYILVSHKGKHYMTKFLNICILVCYVLLGTCHSKCQAPQIFSWPDWRYSGACPKSGAIRHSVNKRCTGNNLSNVLEYDGNIAVNVRNEVQITVKTCVPRVSCCISLKCNIMPCYLTVQSKQHKLNRVVNMAFRFLLEHACVSLCTYSTQACKAAISSCFS